MQTNFKLYKDKGDRMLPDDLGVDNLRDIYEQTKYMLKQKIKEVFANDCSGHDYWHSIRVLNNAEKIAKTEKCDEYIVMIAALLHDTDDRKIFEAKNYENARCIMLDCHLTDDIIDHVIEIIREIPFKGTETASPKSIEGKIVQDADRLDAMGAIGIARAFAYGGNHNRAIHIPDCQPNINMDEAAYRNHEGTTINHFYEKLLLMKDMMNTDCAKVIAKKRHEYMYEFMADKALKQEVTEIYERLGMDLPTAFRMFMARSKMVKGLPFEAKLPEQTVTRTEAKNAFYELRKQAADVPEMSLDEINAEILAVREMESKK